MTYTNNDVHNISDNISKCYVLEISKVWTRYPSIEDKIVKFKEKGKHQIF